jgi:nitrogen regulatory protein PII
MMAKDDEVVDNAICGTIHGLMMNALHVAGIEAATINTITSDINIIHYTLMYKVGDGQYVFNNYSTSVTVEAPNVLEVVKAVQKNNQTGDHSDGFVSICTDEGTLTEYALTDVAVFGSEVDKFSDIMKGLSDEDKQRARGWYIDAKGKITAEEFAAQVGYTFGDGTNVDVAYKQNGESSMADNSWSIGAKVGKQWNWTGRLGVDYNLTEIFGLSSTRLKMGGEEHTYEHDIYTFSNDLKLSAQKDLINNGSDRLTLKAETRLKFAATLVPNTVDAENPINGGMGDLGLDARVGLDYTKNFSNTTFNANVSGGYVGAYNRSFVNATIFNTDDLSFNINSGYQIAGGLSLESNNTQGFHWGFGTNGAAMHNSTEDRLAASGYASIGYFDPTGTSVTSSLTAGYERREIHNGFNEVITDKLKFGAGVTATFNNGLGLFANMSQEVNLLKTDNPQFNPNVTVGTSFKF